MTRQLSVLSVSQLNRQVRSWLEHELGEVCVEGEVSNLSKPASGHFYFTLKDASAQLRCVYFRNHHTNDTRLIMQNGQQIIARGRLSLYEARGDYQLIVEEVSEAGQGDLFRQFELLKTKLAALGLFEPQRKKPLPQFPIIIGVITSKQAAALHDILTTLARRYPLAEVIVYPSDVQGKQAAPQLINAIAQANHDRRCDVLILARGGGSIEDLWAFNDEHLAHAIAASQIPIVSGIGHETDFTIADFVADFRAATPTAAAEAITPNAVDLLAYLQAMQARLITATTRFVQHKQLLLSHEIQKITSPSQLIATHWQTLDYLSSHLQRALLQSLAQKRHRLHLTLARLTAKNPGIMLQQARIHLQGLESQLLQQTVMKLTACKQQFATQLATLHAVSPLATLDRGYAIVTHRHKVLYDNKQVKAGDIITIRLAKGMLDATVEKRESPDEI